jgi:hypothetical protein
MDRFATNLLYLAEIAKLRGKLIRIENRKLAYIAFVGPMVGFTKALLLAVGSLSGPEGNLPGLSSFGKASSPGEVERQGRSRNAPVRFVGLQRIA